jgi:PAT family beta-lactamase induction signal transducer AmpG
LTPDWLRLLLTQADADLCVHRFQLRPAALPAAQPAAGLVAQRGVDLKTIGFFALIQFPYTWKFLWAPLLDRYRLPLGRRRGWMLLSQIGLLLSIGLLGGFSPSTNLTR